HPHLAGVFPSEVRGLTGELSSRSDGRLFAFFTGNPFSLAEIDPLTAEVRSQKPLAGMHFSAGGGSWAFAAVGSEFFFFWADQAHPSSTVTRLKEDGTLEHVIRDAGIQIVGAGASTCAPTKPSKGEVVINAPAEPAPIEVDTPPPAPPPP